jgi:hypothetical protein
MVDIRGFNGGLNTDSSPELLPNGDYTYAYNITNGSEGITNLLGNRLLEGVAAPVVGNDWVCGAHFDKTRQRIIYFTHNSSGYHRIISVDVNTQVHTILFENNVGQNPVTQTFTESKQIKIYEPILPPPFSFPGFFGIITVQGANLNLSSGASITISGSVSNNKSFIVDYFQYVLNTTTNQFENQISITQDPFGSLVPEEGIFNITYSREISVSSSVFDWPLSAHYDPNYLIKDIKVIHREYEGDLIYFIDPNKMLLKFNYDTLLNNGYGPNPRIDYFKVIKAPPKDIISVDVVDDSNYKINNLYKKLFQFKYRYVYDDNEKSVWSAISIIPYPTKSTDALYNALSNVQNAINLSIQTGDINVDKIEIAGRVNIEDNWSDFFLVDTLVKERDNVSDNTVYTYKFRNDSVYTPIDIQESNLLFDYVPDEANALELANGNTLVVGGLKDGYDRDISLDVILTNVSNSNSPAVLSTLTAEVRNTEDTLPWTPNNTGDFGFKSEFALGLIKFDGVPQVGDIITIRISGYNTEKYFDTIITGFKFTDRYFDDTFSITFQSGWGIADMIDAFINRPNNGSGAAWNVTGKTPLSATPSRPFINPNFTTIPNCLYFGMESRNPALPDNRRYVYYGASVTIKRSFSFGQSDVFPTYKWNGVYKFGLVYYSKDGKTNGVFTNPQMTLRTNSYNTDYDWTSFGSPVIIPENETAQLYIGHEPPEWADYYHIVRTKELSCDFSLMALSVDVERIGAYVYLDIQNIIDTNNASKETSKVVNYNSTTFVDGDRVRILKKYDKVTKAVIWEASQPKDFLDLPILSVELRGPRLSLKLPNVDTSTNPNIITMSDNDILVLEIYRPAKVLSDEDLVYYEIGYKYNVLTDSSGNKYHDGQNIVNDIIVESYSIISPSAVTFFSATGSVSITNSSLITGLSVGDTITISGSSFNDGTYNIASLVRGSSLIIFFQQGVEDEFDTTPNITINKLANLNKPYAYINMFGDGDYYYKTRTMICDKTTTNFGPFFVAEKNFSETYLSAVWSQGRPLIVDENIKEEYYPSMLRFSQSYIYGTNINNISRFYPNNFEEADASFGDILRLKTRENFIRMFQRYKVGMIPIYRQIIIDNAQSSQVALSERLLNKPNYYSGEYGIDKYGSSLVSTDYGDYFIDTNNKAIVRVSLDGITNISDTNNLSAWANQNIKEHSYGYGCFNYENRNVIMLIGEIDSSTLLSVNNIVAYSESDKKFESFYGFTKAESILFINGFIYSLYVNNIAIINKGWHLYIHDSQTRNNFFGEQQSSSISTVFNGGLQAKKTYTAIEELSNGLWTGSIATGPLTNQLTSLSTADFQKVVGAFVINSKENKFNATIKRDENSAGGKYLGIPMKGLYAQVALTNSLTTEQRLISVSLKYITSPLTNS